MINVLNILFVVIATGLILCFFRKKMLPNRLTAGKQMN